MTNLMNYDPPDLSDMDLSRLRDLRGRLTGNLWIPDLEEEIRRVDDAIWRREDDQVDDQTLAAYAATRVTWADALERWPAARAAWDREVVPDDDGLALLVHAGPPKTSPHGGKLTDTWLLAVDESRGCRLRGPLSKGVHSSGCRCRLWQDGHGNWRDLAREGIIYGFSPGDQVEGVVLGHGEVVTFTTRVPPNSLEKPPQREVETWLVHPPGRLPLCFLTSLQLDAVLPGLVGQAVRITRLADHVDPGTHWRTAQYAVRPVDLAAPAPGGLSWRERRVLAQAAAWLREDWGGAVTDGLRWVGAGDRQPPALSRSGATARLAVLVTHARTLLRDEAAGAIVKLYDAVAAEEAAGRPERLAAASRHLEQEE